MAIIRPWLKTTARGAAQPGPPPLCRGIGRHDDAVLYGYNIPRRLAGVDLPRTGDLLLGVGDQFLPLGQPPGSAGDGEQDGEDLRFESHSLIHDAGVEVDVGIELALDEVVVLKGDALQFQGDIQLGIAAGDFEYLVGGPSSE